MKKTYMIRFFFLFALLLFSVYFASYRFTSEQMEEEKELVDIDSEEESSLISVDTNKQETVTNQTKYILETYDSKNYTLTEEELSPPADYVGLNRVELINAIQDYEDSPSLQDMEKGFQSFELMSFSADRIVLRKTYYPYDENYKYYLIEENGFITVYYVDQETVYEYTDISLDTLPESLQTDIKSGKCIKNTEELYNFLENYSS